MAALQYVSENGNNASQLEFEKSQVLCLYQLSEPLAHLRPSNCNGTLFADKGQLSDNFNTLQLYIEETLLFFVEERRMAKRYRSSFYGGLPYWRDDSARDPTGAIAFYVLSRELNQAGQLRKIDPQSVACLE